MKEGYAEAVKRLIEKKITVSTMESCTGGMLASVITNVSGASEILSGAFVTYSNEAKIRQGVPAATIERFGVYSEETAKAMAYACSQAYGTILGVGITGSLGRRDPNNPDSVTGQVHFALYYNGDFATAFISVPEKITEREEMKEYVLDAVFDLIDDFTK